MYQRFEVQLFKIQNISLAYKNLFYLSIQYSFFIEVQTRTQNNDLIALRVFSE